MKNNHHSKKGILGGKGFYAAVLCCAAIIGVSGYVAYKETADKLEEQLTPRTTTVTRREWTYEDFTDANSDKDDVPRETTTVATTTAPVTEAKPVIAETVIPVETKPEPYAYPLANEIVNEYSKGELVKSKTLNCWKTHDGVDIQAELGEQVKSMTTGKVLEVYEDALWGVCVVIDHGNGVEGHYRSLAKNVNVKPDQKVSAGTVIGAVGNTAECEIAEVTHLHFGVRKNGEWIDPIAFIRENMV